VGIPLNKLLQVSLGYQPLNILSQSEVIFGVMFFVFVKKKKLPGSTGI
jgi:hypothetical protein